MLYILTSLHLHKGQNASKLVLLKIGTVSRYPEFDGTPICLICSLVKSFNKYYYFKITSRFENVIPCSRHKYCFWQRKILHYAFSHVFDLVMLCFVMILLTQSTPKTRILGSTTHSPRFGAKNEIYYSLLLFTVTIHCYYSLSLFTCYYSLRIFAYLRGVVPYIWSKFWVCLVQDFFPRESYHLWAFLWEISLLTTTSYHLYKACNS